VLVSVHYATAPGTAQDGADFVAVSGAVPIAPGQTQVFIRVSVIGDSVHEGDESLSLLLAKPVVGATLGTSEAAGTIFDDDP
jgi:chitinase